MNNEKLRAAIEQVMRALFDTRDEIERVMQRHAEELAPLKVRRDKLENCMLELLHAVGDSVTIRGLGTAYTRVDTSVGVADAEAFFDFVRNAGAWDMLQARASQGAVMEYTKAHGEPPPGIKISQRRAVGVRRVS